MRSYLLTMVLKVVVEDGEEKPFVLILLRSVSITIHNIMRCNNDI